MKISSGSKTKADVLQAYFMKQYTVYISGEAIEILEHFIDHGSKVQCTMINHSKMSNQRLV